MMADETQGRSMAIGQVLSRAFGLMASNPITVFSIVFLFAALPQLIAMTGLQAVLAGSDRSSLYAVAGTYAVVAMLLSMVAQGAITHASVAYSRGAKAGIGACLATALRMILPLTGISILMTLGIWLGMALFIVPGLILAMMWSVAIPALVAENSGVIGALGRSRALTSGSKWRVFGLFVVAGLIYALLAFAFSLLVLLAGLAANGIAGMILNGIATTLSVMIIVVLPASLYIELRDVKDGPVTEALSEIFA